VKDSELLENEVINSRETQYITAFSIFTEERQDIIKQKYPKLSFLEVIALLQEEWAEIDTQQREYYQLKAEQSASDRKMKCINFYQSSTKDKAF